MANVNDTDTQKLVMKAAEELMKMDEIRPPDWSKFAKTGVHKQRPPQQKNWWYIRSASVLRKIYLEEAGVERLRKIYGGRKNLGHQPEHKRKASGAVLRKILQQLESAGFVKKEKGAGRKITPKGQSFLNNVAKGMK